MKMGNIEIKFDCRNSYWSINDINTIIGDAISKQYNIN